RDLSWNFQIATQTHPPAEALEPTRGRDAELLHELPIPHGDVHGEHRRVMERVHGFAILGRDIATDVAIRVLLPAKNLRLRAHLVELAAAAVRDDDTLRRSRIALVQHRDNSR